MTLSHSTVHLDAAPRLKLRVQRADGAIADVVPVNDIATFMISAVDDAGYSGVSIIVRGGAVEFAKARDALAGLVWAMDLCIDPPDESGDQ